MPEHGTTSRHKYHKCTCDQCRQAWRDYQNRVRRLQAYGRWEPFVDAGPSREHVKALQAAGVGPLRVAELSGIGYATISDLLWRDKRQVRHVTEAALLGVRVELDSYADGAVVDGTGTRRRIQALAVLGWSIPVQARLLGLSRASVQYTLAGHGVQAATARTAREVYEKYWDQTPPEVSRGERISAGRARAEAARRGWAPPMAWDDIDDPAEVPGVDEDSVDVDEVAIERALGGEQVDLTDAEAEVVVRVGTERGMSARVLAHVTGRSGRTITRYRAGAA